MSIADISKWQGKMDWEAAKEELEMTILRASVGNSTVDTQYLRNVEECSKWGIPFGAYHYVKAGTAEEAKEEAQFFIKTTKSAVSAPLFYIADIEYKTQNKDTTEPVCVAFLEELRAQGCRRIGLYINTRYKWAGAAISMCDIIWTPHWGKNTGEIPEDKYRPSHYCDIWQYTSVGKIAGTKYDVDLNLLIGDKDLNWFINGDDKQMYTCSGNGVNVRVGDNTSYESIGKYNRGDYLAVVLDAEEKPIISKNGWYAIYYNNRIGWISGAYVK